MRCLILVAAAAVGAAQAADIADKPVIAPPAAWVIPAALPADTGKADEAAVRVLLQDQQLRLLPEGEEVYTETAVRVQTPQGLQALGNITIPWKPDTSTLTVHKLHIVRAGKVIDVLANGNGFTVLRRENGLEYAALDGVLTAVIQPEGLQVGDIVDLAATIRAHDPVLAGHPEGSLAGWANVPVAHVRSRAIWDKHLPVRWRATDATPAVHESRDGGTTEISLSADDLQPILYPKDAPPRFRLPRLVETTSFASWADLSALFDPLYVKAAALKPDSALKAEIVRIAAASPDPAVRAEAALALVQDQVRYVFLGINDGGLLPAPADLTWQRRFGDCKGKTVLLLALLHGLGIEAVPAVVSTRFGDGMNERLPMVGLFDHILVRTTIAGHVYWLDGTRTGDRRLADISVPPFRWALPIRPRGAVLERLPEVPAIRPFASSAIRIDATAGIGRPAPFHAETVTRADQATGLRLSLANMTPEVRDRALHDYWTKQYDFLTVKTAAASYDEKAGEEHLVVDGTAAMDWSHHSYEADGMGIGYSADFSRQTGPHSDAPFAVGFPGYERVTETILLPNGGKGFAVDTPDVDQTVAGIEYHRKARLAGATYTVEKSERSIGPEFPASEAAADQAALRALAKQRVFVNQVGGYIFTPQEKSALLAGEPKIAQDFMDRAAVHFQRQEWRLALADYTQVIALDPSRSDALAWRGVTHAALNEPVAALTDADKAVALSPNDAGDRVCRARIRAQQGRTADALADVDAALSADPANLDALGLRAALHRSAGQAAAADADLARLAKLGSPEVRAAIALSQDHADAALAELDKAGAATSDDADLRAARARVLAQLGRNDEALAESAAAIRRKPDMIDMYLLRANLYQHLGKPDLRNAEARAAVTANPGSDYAHVVAGAIYARARQQADAAREFDEAIALKPSVYAYLTRADNRPRSDVIGRRGDIAAALALEPGSQEASSALGRLDLDGGNYAGLLAASDTALRADASNHLMLLYRGIAYDETGKPDLAAKDFAAFRTGSDSVRLNNACWTKATHGVSLASALLDCDLALKEKPGSPMILDSRAFVLLRLGRNAEALDAYDQAVKLRPSQAESLYGRGLVKLRMGRAIDAQADFVAARKADGGIDAEFKGYGLTP